MQFDKQGDATNKLAIAEKMERFGRELESDGVVHAGKRLVRLLPFDRTICFPVKAAVAEPMLFPCAWQEREAQRVAMKAAYSRHDDRNVYPPVSPQSCFLAVQQK